MCVGLMAQPMREQAPTTQQDDAATIAAAAIIAACLTTIAHEALGHGGACLASGGRIVLLTSVYFECARTRDTDWTIQSSRGTAWGGRVILAPVRASAPQER